MRAFFFKKTIATQLEGGREGGTRGTGFVSKESLSLETVEVCTKAEYNIIIPF